MDSEYHHKILVVDKDKQAGKAISSIIQTESFECVVLNNGESALDVLKKTDQTFSLIIAYQGLSGMTGIQLLEHAKELTPESTRFLMTSHSEVKTIIDAVNMGEIQRYIVKPWKKDYLIYAIKSGIKLYELFLDNKKLLKLAKKQNTKLYELNCGLMEATTQHNKTAQELDNDIETIKKELKEISCITPVNPGMLLDEIKKNFAKDDQSVDSQAIQTIFSDTIKKLYEQFTDLAHRNAFEMPEIKGEAK